MEILRRRGTIEALRATANGDGAGGGTDIASKINARITALSAGGGGTLYIPLTGTGIFRLATAIEMKSNVTVQVAPGVTFDHSGLDTSFLKYTGTAGAWVNTSADRTRGDTAISTTAAHDLAVGQRVQIMGPVNALSVDAGVWRLGNGTASLNAAYFTEWLQAAEITSATAFRSTVPLIFPSYLISNATLTDEPRTRTTIRKITPVENAHWFGGRFIATTGTNGVLNGPVLGVHAVNCSFQDAVIEKGTGYGGAVFWVGSLDCFAKNVRAEGNPALVWDYAVHHGEMNRFRVVSSQDCGFDDCYNEFDSQPFDLTYSSVAGADLACSIRPYVKNSKTRRCFEAATSHPGSFGEQWLDNKFLDCLNGGLLIRGRRATAKRNTITSTTEAVAIADATRGLPSIGIDLYAGHAKDADLGENTISGHRYAFGFRDGSVADEYFSRVNAFIHGNTVRDCYAANYNEFNAANVADRGIIWEDNAFFNVTRSDVVIDNQTGCVYRGNTDDGAPLEHASQSVTIASGAVSYFSRDRITMLIVDNEAAAAADDLDQIIPLDGVRDGDIVIVNQFTNARDVTLRDLATSGAATNGLQMPGNTSINLANGTATATFIRRASAWFMIANALN